jgi:hypothetical protein
VFCEERPDAAEQIKERAAHMIISYCQKCGQRIAEADVDSGAASIREEGEAYCAKCALSLPAAERPGGSAPSRKSEPVVKMPRQRGKTSAQSIVPVSHKPSARTNHHPARARPQSRLFLIGGVVTGLALVLALAMFGRDTASRSEANNTHSDQDTRRKADDQGSPSSDRSVSKAENQATTAPGQEPDGYNPREALAQSLLDQAKAGFAKAPDNPQAYQEKLRALADAHAGTKAGKEAKAILERTGAGTEPAPPPVVTGAPEKTTPTTSVDQTTQPPAEDKQGRTICVDFGGSSKSNAGTWNNLSGQAVENLICTDGKRLGYRLTVTDAFAGINTNGTTTPDAALSLPPSATSDTLYGCDDFGGKKEPTAQLTIDGLDPAKTYRLTFFASRMGVKDNRQTEYKVTGASSETLYLNASNNTSAVAASGWNAPDTAGRIVVDLKKGSENNNSNGFYYLGALKLESAPVADR